MSDHYEAWLEAALVDPSYTPLDESTIRQMFLWTTQHGPPNCWTGTTGHAAAMIRQLLKEREHLIDALLNGVRPDSEDQKATP